MSKVKPRLTRETVLQYFSDNGVVLDDREAANIAVLIDLVKASERHRREQKNPKSAQEMQVRREKATEMFPELHRRSKLLQHIVDMLD